MSIISLLARKLPKAYEQLSYIETTSVGPYIDTGFKATSMNLKAETTLTKRSDTKQNTNYFGFDNATSDSNWWTLYNNSGHTESTFWAGTSGGEYNKVFEDTGTTTFHHVIVETKYTSGSSGTLVCYGDGVKTVDTTFNTSFIANPGNFALFTNGGYGVTDRLAQCKMQEFKIWQDDVLVRNFVPARRIYDSEIGMYDTVTETFYTNAGTGTFTAGEVVPTVSEIEIPRTRVIPSEYQQYGGLVATGTQYIDTGITLTGDSKVKVQYSVPTVAQNGVCVGGRYDSSADTFCLWGIVQATVVPRFDYGSGADAENGNTVYANTVYTLIKDKNKNYQNGATITEQTYEEYTTPVTAYLFNMHKVSGSDFPMNGTIYYCKIWNNGTLVRNFVPVKRLADDVCGMWDLVSQTFFTNIGTGSFTVTGTPIGFSDDVEELSIAVKETDDYEFLGYLETTEVYTTPLTTATAEKNAYIDTGIVMSGDGYKYEIKFNRSPYPSGQTAAVGICGAQNGTAICCLYDASAYWNGTTSAGSDRIKNIGITDNTDTVVVASGSGQSLSYSRNGTKYTGSTQTNFTALSNTFTLFRNHNVDTVAIQPMIGKIYYFKMWKSGELIRNMVPARRKSDSELGMLDLVENTFYPNAGDGTASFTSGGESSVSRTIWTKAPEIPSTYTQKSYIENTAGEWATSGSATPSNVGSYINTGINPTPNGIVKMKLQIADATGYSDPYVCLFGGYDSNTKNFGIVTQPSKTYFLDGGQTNISATWNYDGSTDYEIEYSASGKYLIQNGTKTTFSISGLSTTSDLSIYLFTNNATGSLSTYDTTYTLKGKIYYFQYYEGTDLIMDLVPAVRNSDSVAGMYDKVTDTFYTNTGSGTFVTD